MNKMTLATIGALGLFCTIARAQEADSKFALPHITVSGTAFVEVKPDIATLQLGVVTEKPTAAEAASENAIASTATIATLKKIGVEPKDIRTSNLTLSPVMVEERDPKTQGVVKRNLTGYRTSNSLSVRIRDVDKAGVIASQVVEAGANTYQGLYFSVSDPTARADTMRAKAVGEAMRRAALFAHGASMKLGRLLAIDPEPDRRSVGEADLPMRRPDIGPHVVVIPVEPGTERVEATVSATWELVPE
jgi:uncharacterized protein